MSQEYNVSGNDAVNLSTVLLLWMIERPVDEMCWESIISIINDPPIEDKDVANKMCPFLEETDVHDKYLYPSKVKIIFVCTFVSK